MAGCDASTKMRATSLRLQMAGLTNLCPSLIPDGSRTCRLCNTIGRAVLRGNRPVREDRRVGATICLHESGECEILVWDSPAS